jgi:hypothetical protein
MVKIAFNVLRVFQLSRNNQSLEGDPIRGPAGCHEMTFKLFTTILNI